MKSRIIQHENTSHLIENVKEELSKAGYKPGTIQVYQRYWSALLKYEANKRPCNDSYCKTLCK